MMADMIIVCCKLPCGIILDHPDNPDKKIPLKGRNRSLIVGQDYGTTEIENSVWESWALANSDSMILRSGAVYASKNLKSIEKMAEEYSERKTGFEAMPQDSLGVQTMVA